MKKNLPILVLALLILVAGWPKVLSAETEPNNTADQANTLAANGSDSGTLDKSTDGEDRWKVTIPANGKLVIATSSIATLEIRQLPL